MGSGNGGSGNTSILKMASQGNFIDRLMKLATVITVLCLPVAGLYLYKNYVPREEVEKKYVPVVVYERALGDIETLKQDVSDIEEKFVTKENFHAKMTNVDEGIRDLKEEVKEANSLTRESNRDIKALGQEIRSVILELGRIDHHDHN